MTRGQKILGGVLALSATSLGLLFCYAGVLIIIDDGDWSTGLLMLLLALLFLIQPFIYSRQFRKPTVSGEHLRAAEAAQERAAEETAYQKLLQAEITRVEPEKYHTKRPRWSLGVAAIIVCLLVVAALIAFLTGTTIPETYLWYGGAFVVCMGLFISVDQDYDKVVEAKDAAGLKFAEYDYTEHFYTDSLFSYVFYLTGKLISILLLLVVLAIAAVSAIALVSGISISPTTVIIVLLVLIFIRLGDITRRLP